MVEQATVQDWLNRYIRAWKSYDPKEIGDLFTSDARYSYNPFQKEPVQGRDAIVESWLESKDPAGSYDAEYSPVAVEGNVAVTNGRSRYFAPDGKTVVREYDNIFVLRFDDTGRCAEFREWFMKRREE